MMRRGMVRDSGVLRISSFLIWVPVPSCLLVEFIEARIG